jgi:hypothetical protein
MSTKKIGKYHMLAIKEIAPNSNLPNLSLKTSKVANTQYNAPRHTKDFLNTQNT